MRMIMKTNKYIHFSVALIASLLMFSENAWGYTATFSTGLGNPTVSPVAESYNGGGITLPDGVTPAADDWEFVGWAMASCSESTKAPVLYLAGTKKFTLTANTTMYAVYRKYTSGTSTVTFNAADISNLTVHPRYSRDWTDNTAGIDLYLSAGQRYTSGTPNTWTVTKSTDASGTENDVWNYAMITAYRKISQIIVVLSGEIYLIDDEGYGIETDVDTNDDYAMQVSSPTAVEPYTQTVSQTGDVDAYATQVWMFSTTSQQIRAKSIQITYYNAKFNSNPCDNLVELTAGTKTNVSSITFSLSSVPTCSSTAADRQVTITVTTNTGYEMTGSAKPTFSKTSGTVTATYVSGPTGSGPYAYVYRFDEDDSGAGTFSVTSATPKSYTVTLNDNSGSGGSGSKVVTYLSNTNLTTNVIVPTRTHYIFGGYWTSSDGGSTLTTQLINADGSWKASVSGYTDASKNWQGTSNLTIYAKWTEHSYTNYRTKCCDDPGLAFDGEYNYQTLVRQDIHGAQGGNGSATVEQGKATLVLDYSTESSGTCTVEVKKLTGADKRSTAAAGSSCSSYTTIAVDGTNKKVTFEIWTYAASYPTANGQGTYRIKLSQAAESTYCATDIYYFVDVTLRDKFVDAVNGNSTINVDGQSKLATDYYKTPAESDMDADLNDDCNSTTRRLIGWIKETDLQTMYGTPGETGYLEGAASYNASKVVAPYADFTTSGCTWYAVWGVDNTPEP